MKARQQVLDEDLQQQGLPRPPTAGALQGREGAGCHPPSSARLLPAPERSRRPRLRFQRAREAERNPHTAEPGRPSFCLWGKAVTPPAPSRGGGCPPRGARNRGAAGAPHPLTAPPARRGPMALPRQAPPPAPGGPARMGTGVGTYGSAAGGEEKGVVCFKHGLPLPSSLLPRSHRSGAAGSGGIRPPRAGAACFPPRRRSLRAGNSSRGGQGRSRSCCSASPRRRRGRRKVGAGVAIATSPPGEGGDTAPRGTGKVNRRRGAAGRGGRGLQQAAKCPGSGAIRETQRGAAAGERRASLAPDARFSRRPPLGPPRPHPGRQDPPHTRGASPFSSA